MFFDVLDGDTFGWVLAEDSFKQVLALLRKVVGLIRFSLQNFVENFFRLF